MEKTGRRGVRFGKKPMLKRIVRKLKEPLFDFCYRVLMSGTGSTGSTRTPYGTAELKRVHQALRSQRLFRGNGDRVSQFEKDFATAYGVPHAVASTSGTSAIHVALGSLDLEEGDEIITTSITDMGTIVPILAERAVPVFADIDDTYTLDPASLEERITERTRALLVVHLFGNPCDMDSIMSIARRHDLPVIEDCAQAHLTRYKGRFVGTIGEIGCFSFQESKHLTTGDGGMTITGNAAHGERMRLFADKGFDRNAPGPVKYRFQAPNYRMTELTAAVGLAQLEKVAEVVRSRNRIGTMLTERLAEMDGIKPAPITPGGEHSYWSYPLFLEEADVDAFLRGMKAAQVPAGAHMNTPVYLTAASLRSENTGGTGSGSGPCPRAETLSRHLVNLWINENWDENRVEHVVKAIKTSVPGATTG